MKKLILILILIVFSVTQSVAGAIGAGPVDIKNSTGEMTAFADNPAVSENADSAGTRYEKCCEKHSMKGANDASSCPIDCLLVFAIKVSSNAASPGSKDFVLPIPLTGTTLEAKFRPPIS